ncbi:hypothetical protein ENBRE01_3305 [Enteropsectra breve]|nr:hypothetical protein ENBRE01_3305 [Enteropsectra breve]
MPNFYIIFLTVLYKTVLYEGYLYLERTYLGFLNSDRVYTSPRFTVEFWNISARILGKIPQTTNMIEAWHRSFNTRNMVSHPNIAHLIIKMQQDEEIDRLNLLRAKAGNFRLADSNLLKEEKLYILCAWNKNTLV